MIINTNIILNQFKLFRWLFFGKSYISRFSQNLSASSSADQIKHLQSFFQSPRSPISTEVIIGAHLLPLILNVSWGSRSLGSLVEVTSNLLPESPMFFDQPSEAVLLFKWPFAFVVIRVEPSSTQVVAWLNTPIRQALWNYWPRAIQLLWQICFRFVA